MITAAMIGVRPLGIEYDPDMVEYSKRQTAAAGMTDRASLVKADLLGQPGCDISFCRVLHWVVPQKVEGTYTVAQGEVRLEQEFQMLTGTLKQGTTVLTLTGRVYGEQIMLSAGNKQYVARLSGGRLELREP